ncbi:CIA30-domain-containing protein, partial [Microstroma glucosiphilum]
TQLYGPAQLLEAPGRPWSVDDFKAVDDRVRGGASTSAVRLTEPQGDKTDAKAGELVFSGFLDITTLGGAGFASQQCIASPPFPVPLSQQNHSGLRLLVRPAKGTTDATADDEGKAPGGGKGPVRSYLLNLYPKLPVKRPDGRNESSITYEHTFRLDPPVSSSSPDGDDSDDLLSVDLAWNDFKPFYRGKPAEDAGPLDPSEVKIWSLMARSDFGAQSGPFELQVHSLWAVGKEEGSLSASQGHEVCGKERACVWAKEEDRWQPADMSGSTGFALYLFATLALVIWTLWALTPDAWLKALGIDWYPSREWAFILPSFSLVLVLFAYIAYLGLNIQMTPDLSDLRTMTG